MNEKEHGRVMLDALEEKGFRLDASAIRGLLLALADARKPFATKSVPRHRGPWISREFISGTPLSVYADIGCDYGRSRKTELELSIPLGEPTRRSLEESPTQWAEALGYVLTAVAEDPEMIGLPQSTRVRGNRGSGGGG